MDFAPRDKFIVTDDDLHASLASDGIADRLAIFFRKFDQSINQQIADSVACHVAEDSGSSGAGPPTRPHAGAAAVRPFNLDACFIFVPANAEGEGA